MEKATKKQKGTKKDRIWWVLAFVFLAIALGVILYFFYGLFLRPASGKIKITSKPGDRVFDLNLSQCLYYNREGGILFLRNRHDEMDIYHPLEMSPDNVKIHVSINGDRQIDFENDCAIKKNTLHLLSIGQVYDDGRGSVGNAFPGQLLISCDNGPYLLEASIDTGSCFGQNIFNLN